MDDGIRPGDLVISLRGRDAGKVMLVVGHAPDGRLLLADGRTHRIASPKKKQKKHVKPLARPQNGICDKLRSGTAITNKECWRITSSVRGEDGFLG